MSDGILVAVVTAGNLARLPAFLRAAAHLNSQR
jgi:hypothetical protein